MKVRRWLSPEAKALCRETGEPDAAIAIKRLAANLIDLAFDQPPFVPAILASFQGVLEVRPRQMESAARLVPELGGLVIEVNQDHPQGKQNLSVNHETCHTLMPTYSGQLVDDAETGMFPLGSSSEEELLCDIGGAALLLDERWFRPMVLDADPSLASLFALAGFFGASLHATAWQLAELVPWPVAIVIWEENFRKAERATAELPLLLGFEEFGRPQQKLRVKHVYATPSFGTYVPINKSVNDSSLVAACCDSSPESQGIEVFDFGNHSVRLYCENIYTPYKRGASLRRRVISMLLPVTQKHSSPTSPVNYRLEMS